MKLPVPPFKPLPLQVEPMSAIDLASLNFKPRLRPADDMTTAEPQVAFYSRDYFIRKFEAIPEEFWTDAGIYEDGFGGKCALGHCGVRHSIMEESHPEARALMVILGWGKGPVEINDGLHHRYQQSTPKQRILAALRDLK